MSVVDSVLEAVLEVTAANHTGKHSKCLAIELVAPQVSFHSCQALAGMEKHSGYRYTGGCWVLYITQPTPMAVPVHMPFPVTAR